MKRYQKNTFIFAAILILLCFNACSSKQNTADDLHPTLMIPEINANQQGLLSEVKSLKLQTNMRNLWEEHVVWTRNVLFCIVDDLPGKEQAVRRLLRNQVEIGSLYEVYYGSVIGTKLSDLLQEHVNLSATLMTVSKSGNLKSIEEANQKWQANADEITYLWCDINPNWNLGELKIMMDKHLKLTYNEVLRRINKDYISDIQAFDQVHKEALLMADHLTNAIVMQFPEKFHSKTPANKKNQHHNN